MEHIALFSTKRWTLLDEGIKKTELLIGKVVESIDASKDEAPDVETMIDAATRQLRSVNARLMRRDFPQTAKKDGEGKYYCPSCGAELPRHSSAYCDACGQRIATLRKELPIKECRSVHAEIQGQTEP